MKTKLLLLFATACTGLALNAQDIAPGINYSYNPPGSDGIIHGITVDVLNNDNNSAGSFDVSMYLYDMSSQNYWVIGTTNIPSLSGNSLITISNWDIDINNTPGIPAGTYRLGIWVDSNDDIAETDEGNNTGLLSGNINYSPSSSSGVANISLVESSVNCSPNPADGETVVRFTLTENASATIAIYDMTGKLVETVVSNSSLSPGEQKIAISTSALTNGIYFVSISVGGEKITRRIVVDHA